MTPFETIGVALILMLLGIGGLGILSIAALLLCAVIRCLRGEQP